MILDPKDRYAFSDCLGSQKVFWSVLNGFSLPKGVFDFVEEGDLVRVLTHRLFLSEVQSRNLAMMTFLKDKTTLVRLPRIIFGQSSLDSTLSKELKEVLANDEQALKTLEAAHENIRSEAAASVIQLFSAFENSTDFIEAYMTKEMLPHLLYLSYKDPYEQSHEKAVQLQFWVTSLASILKSIFQKDSRYKLFFSILPTIENGYLLKRLIKFACHPAIEDIITFMSIRRLKTPSFHQSMLNFLDKWKPLTFFTAIIRSNQAMRLPLCYLDSCKNYFVLFSSQRSGPLATYVILSNDVQQIARYIPFVTHAMHLKHLTEIWLCIAGQCMFKIHRLSLVYKDLILDALKSSNKDLDSFDADIDSIADSTLHIIPTSNILDHALKQQPILNQDFETLLANAYGEQFTQIISQEAENVLPYINALEKLISNISSYARKLSDLFQTSEEGSSAPFSLMLEYAKFFARMLSIPAALKAYIYDFERGNAPNSEFNGVGIAGEMYFSLDGSQYADLPETGAASVGGTSDVKLSDTVFLYGRVRFPCSVMTLIEAIDASSVPITLLRLLTTYQNGTYAHSSTLAFYVFRIFKVILAYSKFNSTLVDRIFKDYGLEDLIREFSSKELTQQQQAILPFVRDLVLTAFRLAAGISDIHAYIHKKRNVSLRNDSLSGQGRACIPEVLAQMDEMIDLEHANMHLLLYLQESQAISLFNDTHCVPLLTRDTVFSDAEDVPSAKSDESSNKKRYIADQSVIDSLTASLQSF